MTKPHLPIPEPHRGREPDTWAFRTVSARFKNTAQRILEENQFSAEIIVRLQDLINEIPDVPIRLIDDPHAPDEAAWNRYLLPYLGKNWLEPPWFFVEHYFYRRILEATGYFQLGNGFQIDPFNYQKQTGLEVSRLAIDQLMTRINSWLRQKFDNREILRDLFYLDLWGNQADLSLWPAEGENKPDHRSLESAQAHILVDEVNPVIDILLGFEAGQSRLDLLLDNAGFELVCDLALTDYFLTAGLASSVHLHAKPHPTYVSDAMEKDVRLAIQFLQSQNQNSTRKSGERLQSYLEDGHLQFRGNYFWTSPLDGWEMPVSLREELSHSNLVISKGDANYRRLVGDRHWPFTIPFAEILSYFPAPLLALRTLKSEVIPGLKPGQAEKITAQDPDWLIDGRWGVLQFYPGSISKLF